MGKIVYYSMDILEQLFEKNYAIKDIIISEKLKASVRSLSMESQLLIEKEMMSKSTEPASKVLFMHKYGTMVLKHTLISYNNQTFTSPEEAEKCILQLSPYVLNKLISEQGALEKEIRVAITPEAIEQTFFETPPSPEK